MNATEILQELSTLGNENIKRLFSNYGAPEPFFGVKIGDLKKIQKRIKKNHTLSLELYATGNSDAMYLAGLIADENKISKEELRQWARQASWSMISEYTVPWVASESLHGWELGLEWIESPEEQIASTGWSALSSWVSIRPDVMLDIPVLKQLLHRVGDTIHTAPNRVRYMMNNFIIAVGSYVPELTDTAIATAKKVGKVAVDMRGTACKVSAAVDYIGKVQAAGKIGVKRKMARC